MWIHIALIHNNFIWFNEESPCELMVNVNVTTPPIIINTNQTEITDESIFFALIIYSIILLFQFKPKIIK